MTTLTHGKRLRKKRKKHFLIGIHLERWGIAKQSQFSNNNKTHNLEPKMKKNNNKEVKLERTHTHSGNGARKTCPFSFSQHTHTHTTVRGRCVFNARARTIVLSFLFSFFWWCWKTHDAPELGRFSADWLFPASLPNFISGEGWREM